MGGSSGQAFNVIAALQLWQAFEYLSPQKPPKPERRKDCCTWEVMQPVVAEEDAAWPWLDQEKQDDLAKLFRITKNQRRRFVLYVGIISGAEMVEAARSMLGAPPLDFSEQARPGDAASIVLLVNEDGYVEGRPFISTVPWALAGMANSAGTQSRFDFRGFFGLDGVEAATVKAMQEFLLKRQLVCDEHEDEQQEERVAQQEQQKERRPLNAQDVQQLSELVFQRLGWAPQAQLPWVVQAQRVGLKGDKAPDDPLNSFYAEEIEKIQAHYRSGNYGQALGQFLESRERTDRIDLDKDRHSLIQGVHPSRLPAAAWPGKYPLVTAQQFAVNAIHDSLASGRGIFSVNGPPGTGKTTMLKDILADVIQARADVLYQFEHVDAAFDGRLKIENHNFPAWRLVDGLRGFGVVVTSANNGAVENISKELPGVGAIDPDITLDYFAEVADSLGLKPGQKRDESAKSWGVVSAALGNAANRSKFAQAFWWGSDQNPKTKGALVNSLADPLRPMTLQSWILENQAPSWPDARRAYARAKRQVQELCQLAAKHADLLAQHASCSATHETALDDLQRHERQYEQLQGQAEQAAQRVMQAQVRLQFVAQAHQRIQHLTNLQVQVHVAKARMASHDAAKPARTLEQLAQNCEAARMLHVTDRAALTEHQQYRPSFLWRLFDRGSVRDWAERLKQLEDRVDASRHSALQRAEQLRAATEWVAHREELARQAESAVAQADHALQEALSAGLDVNMPFQQIEREMEAARHAERQAQEGQQRLLHGIQQTLTSLQGLRAEEQQGKARLVTMQAQLEAAGLSDSGRAAWHLLAQQRDAMHQASPYQDDKQLFEARKQLFVASMELHKAFLMNAWKKMKPTLAAFVNVLQGGLPAHAVHGGVMALWDAFFLAVPLVSTTFASFPRLFKGVEREELAWVLIDEAGQASPQQAVGALWRARRAVIVGDPLQLEPVVSVPEEMVEPLRAYCGTGSIYVPPLGSVQTLADRSNRFGTYLGAEDADSRIWLGSPLVVHRRCLNPMFAIANAIAYENKMVYGTFAQAGSQPEPSCWIDMPNTGATGHWIAAQGERCVEQIQALTGSELRDADGRLKVYVITPFRVVAEAMRNRLAQTFNGHDALEMCGTVHTFQGKEADYVIFLLGGDPSKPGVIASFAGRKPNLVNVAVTRAKKRLYVIGKREYWCGATDVNHYFTRMAQELE